MPTVKVHIVPGPATSEQRKAFEKFWQIVISNTSQQDGQKQAQSEAAK